MSSPAVTPMPAVVYNATPITERLVVGAGLTGEDELTWLRSQGVTHVFNCAAELDDLAACQDLGISYTKIPWRDDGSPKDASDFYTALSRTVAAYYAAIAQGKLPRIYVHCAAGVNRGPLLATFLLAALSGISADSAFALIKSLRPQAAALDNAAYRGSCVAALDLLRIVAAQLEARGAQSVDVTGSQSSVTAPAETPASESETDPAGDTAGDTPKGKR